MEIPVLTVSNLLMATLVLKANRVPVMLLLIIGIFVNGAAATVFTLGNDCRYTVWPATLSSSSSTAPAPGGGGLELPPNSTTTLQVPSGWSGRLWARTGCAFAGPTKPSCATGDCAGALACSAAGAAPATLAEFTLAASGDGRDLYDVSLVEGYNVAIGVWPSDRECGYAGCVGDVNGRCPAELRVEGADGDTVACRSACNAFGREEYCCTGAHSVPGTCGPSRYSQLFKAACPRAYSYALDDAATSAWSCAAGTDYLIVFCPSSTSS